MSTADSAGSRARGESNSKITIDAPPASGSRLTMPADATPGMRGTLSRMRSSTSRHRRVVAVLRSRNGEMRGEDVVALEARALRIQRREGARQQHAADEQRQRQRDLRPRPVRCARAIDAPSRWSIASLRAWRRSGRRSRPAPPAAPRRSGPSPTTRAMEASSTSMLMRMFSTRGSVGGASGMNADDRVGGERHAERAADREQRHDFRHRLQRHPAPRGAERQPHGELAASRRGARRQQGRQIQRRHEQQARAPRRASRTARCARW